MGPEVTGVLLEHDLGKLNNLALRNPKRRRQISELHTLTKGTMPQEHSVIAHSRDNRREALTHKELVGKWNIEPIAVVPNEVATLQHCVHANQILFLLILVPLEE